MTKIGTIKAAVVQRVGNKSNEDGVSFSDSLCQLDGVEEYLLEVINASFKFDDWRQFYYIDDLELNPAYRFVSKIFENESAIIKQANNLARHLYEQSIHPNIKTGRENDGGCTESYSRKRRRKGKACVVSPEFRSTY